MRFFLEEEVLNRETKRGPPKAAFQSRTDANGMPIQQTLGSSAIEAYTSAIIDLWKMQHARGENPIAPSQRDHLLKGMLKKRRMDEAERKKSQYLDRGIGTLLDGYSRQELVKCVRSCWAPGPMEKKLERKRRLTAQGYSAWLRTAIDLLATHNMVVRGEQTRLAELADLFCVARENEGPTEYQILCLVMDQGKTNSYGKCEYGVAVRHKDISLCLLSQIAFYLFFRWDIMHEPHPTFRTRSSWYDIRLLRGGERTHPLSYDTQLTWISNCFKANDVTSLKKTHAGRGQGARDAETLGVSEEQIRRAGRWNSDAMSNCYLTNIPNHFVRAAAGFNPHTTGDYLIPRANVPVPEELVRRIWPWVDQWLAWFTAADSDADSLLPDISDGSDPEVGFAERNDLAGQGFLRLLQHLRTILIQDSVLLRRDFPTHPIFQHQVFATSEYLAFVRTTERALEVDQPLPQDVLVRQALPILTERVTLLEESLRRTTEMWSSRIYDEQISQRTVFSDVFNGATPIHLNVPNLGLSRTTADQTRLVDRATDIAASAVISSVAATAAAAASSTLIEDFNSYVYRPFPPPPPPLCPCLLINIKKPICFFSSR
jgi:Centromere DNA-binding protein complex CBF3 subunit, domain 2